MSRRLLVAAVAASIALSACGGSSEKKAAGSQSPTSTVPAASGSGQAGSGQAGTDQAGGDLGTGRQATGGQATGDQGTGEQGATSSGLAPSSTTVTAPSTATTAAAPTTTTKPAITKAAYVKQANAICQTMNNKMAALGDPGDDIDQLIAMLGQSKQIMSETLSKLRALPVPAGQQAALTAIWAKVDVVVADVQAAIGALQAGDEDKATELLDQLDTDTVTANEASVDYGLTVCGE